MTIIRCITSQPSALRLFIAMLSMSAGVMITPAAAQSLTEEKPPRERARQDSGGEDATRAELRKRFEARFAQIADMKDKAVIGETFDGYLAAIDDRLLSRDQKRLVDDENADRRTLYGLIATRVDEGDRTIPPRVVAERNARRNFSNADARHYLRISEHRWILKGDEARAERIARLKRDGVVGETFDGLIEVIRGSVDDQVRAVIEQENRSRRAMYEIIAGRIDKATPEQIGQQLAKEAYEHLPPGHSFKTRQGAWERRPDRQR